MAINDPLGDLLTRIRNAQMRRKSKVSTPGSKLRAHVLDVLKEEGYIRGYSTADFGNGRSEFEIELKYFDGEPVIRQIERVSRPGRRVYAAVGAMPLAGVAPSWSALAGVAPCRISPCRITLSGVFASAAELLAR